MQALITAIRLVPLAELDRGSSFATLPRPNEAEAVDDLWSQLRKRGDGDFSLYAFPLAISPFLDMLLMTMLGLILPRRHNEGDDAAIAKSIGVEPDEAGLINDAFQAAAIDPDWADIVAKTENAGGRWIRVMRIRIELNDWANLHKMRHLVDLGRVHDAGVIDGKHVFVLRARFLFDRFNQIARKKITESRALKIKPIAPRSEVHQ